MDGEALLSALVTLGMRRVATQETLLQAAAFIHNSAERAEQAAVSSGVVVPGVQGQGQTHGDAAAAADGSGGESVSYPYDAMDMVVARGQALLAYLEMEAGRLVAQAQDAAYVSDGRGTAGGTEARGGERREGGGRGLFAAMKGLFQGPDRERERERERRQGGAQGGAAAEAAAAQLARFWGELSQLRWCPVLTEPPAPALPWPAVLAQPPPSISNASSSSEQGPAGSHASSEAACKNDGARRARVAAPWRVRPAGDAWLCSACRDILDGECRSGALASGLGWSAPLGADVLAAQLRALGELHARVSDQGTARLLASVVPQLYRWGAGTCEVGHAWVGFAAVHGGWGAHAYTGRAVQHARAGPI